MWWPLLVSAQQQNPFWPFDVDDGCESASWLRGFISVFQPTVFKKTGKSNYEDRKLLMQPK